MPTLYHYTHLRHWVNSISKDQTILAKADSNLDPHVEHAGPDVVWLTTEAELTADHGLGHPLVAQMGLEFEDKKRVRIEVEVPKSWVIDWVPWARKKRIPEYWLESLTAAGGSDTWRVVMRPITQDMWVSVTDMYTGKDILHQPVSL